jgi:hypothetical protein
MKSELASDLETTGGLLISSGKLREAWLTLSRTSFAAVSKFTPKLNSTVIFEDPTELDELIVLIPGIPLIDFSSGSVI